MPKGEGDSIVASIYARRGKIRQKTRGSIVPPICARRGEIRQKAQGIPQLRPFTPVMAKSTKGRRGFHSSKGNPSFSGIRALQKKAHKKITAHVPA